MEFSWRTRETSLDRFEKEQFDCLIVGGGITGAATARDAATRGLKVALVERKDFAWGTSSRSSKLIHGGLRYLENYEFSLVFEALGERAFLLRSAPHMVRPLPFYLPVYEGDSHGRFILNLGLWLYDVLALFRTPGFHKRLSRRRLLEQIPFLRREGLRGGFRYYDASMWDDVLAVQTLRAAAGAGAAVANYVEAMTPLWTGDRISGFRVRDQENPSREIEIKAHRVIICAGPWTDLLGTSLDKGWHRWLVPSKGVHLVFDLRRIPVPGAMVMNHPEDHRISFVIPRPDFGPGVVIVGTTDGPTPSEPDQAVVEKPDVEYLMGLLQRYFPGLKLTASDILSAYVGVRPLMGEAPGATGGNGGSRPTPKALQQVSREHFIGDGPGGSVVVAGGKYTTHRKMAEEIVDYALRTWERDHEAGEVSAPVPKTTAPRTDLPVNPNATDESVATRLNEAAQMGIPVPRPLVNRYGGDAMDILNEHKAAGGAAVPDLPGFPALAAQLRYAIRREMVVHLEDFYIRRIPLYLARGDSGLPFADVLAQVWAEERGLGAEAAAVEAARLREEIGHRSAWKASVQTEVSRS